MTETDDKYPPARRGTLYHTYRRGWIAGAGGKALDPRFTEHEDGEIGEVYVSAYQDGVEARGRAMQHAGMTFGYKPSILRLAVNEPGPDLVPDDSTDEYPEEDAADWRSSVD